MILPDRWPKRSCRSSKLTPEAQISYDVWKYQYEDAARGAEFRGNQYVFTQMMGVQSMIPMFMINFHRVDERADMEAYIKRLGGMSRAMNQLIDRAQKYADNGVRPPRFSYEGVLDQARKVIEGAPFGGDADSAIWADVNSKIGALVENGAISDEEADTLRESARTAMLDQLKPAYDRLAAWVENEIPLAEENASGVGKLPNGEAYYAYQLASNTTTDMSPDQVHELGLTLSIMVSMSPA